MKHYIETIEDIKRCEENGRTIWSAIDASNYYYEFSNGVWCRYRENDEGKEDDLIEYNCRLCVSSNDTNILYYYEEESEEQMEATEKDVGKLCWFWEENEDKKFVGRLVDFNEDNIDCYEADGEACLKHCRPLTKAEIQEFMEKAE